jgi:hypothetical protein
MEMKRRNFLKQTGLALAIAGAGSSGLLFSGHRYGQALAEPTRRKLALLVGINQYRAAPLGGCVTDVELQRELLLHRYGFQPADILTLTDQQATRQAIEQAFIDHLVNQAKAGDVVVFHFSGYGGSVTKGSDSETVQTSLVPVDDLVQEGNPPVVNDVLEETLDWLVRSLQTDKVTLFLDTGYTYPGKPLLGNLRIRARPLLSPVRAGAAELAFQQQLFNQAPTRLRQTPHPPLPGVLLTATGANKIAAEARWNGFSAGLLTYTLTRYLWHTTPATTLNFWLKRAQEQVETVASQEQQPQLGGQKSQESVYPYFLTPEVPFGADGVILGVDEGGRTAQVWLAGLPAAVLEQYGANSLLVLADNSTEITSAVPTYLQLLARDGLTARVKVYRGSSASVDAAEPPPIVRVGQLVRERVRVLPRNIGLTVALDSTLERIERVDAISAFTAVPRFSAAIAGEQAADYLFSKVSITAPTQIASATNIAGIAAGKSLGQSSYGLFSLGEYAIPNTAGEAGEAVRVAVRRLVPRLQALLAGKLLNLTVNETSSQLPLRVVLEKADAQPQVLESRATQAIAPTKAEKFPAQAKGLLTLPTGSRIQYRLENRSTYPVHSLILGTDSSGNLSIFYGSAPASTAEQKSTVPSPVGQTVVASIPLAPAEVLTLPASTATWAVQPANGLSETFVIFSRTPFSQTQQAIESALRQTATTPAIYPLQNPLDVVQALLQDLHQASDTAAQVIGNPPDSFILDMNTWAGFRFVYQVV